MQPDPTSVMLAGLALLPTGLAVRASLRLVYGARGPKPDDVTHYLVTVVSWVLVAASILVISLATLGFSIVIGAIAGYAVLDLVIARRSQGQQMAWSLVSGATVGRQPLQLAVDLGRERFRGGARRRFEKFANDVVSGVDTTSAIARRKKTFPRSAQGLAALAKGGDLGVLGANEIDEAAPSDTWSIVAGRFGYLLSLGFVMASILTFMFIKIVPEFRKIFAEFGLPLPAMTESVIGVSVFVQLNLIGVILIQVLLLAVLTMVVLWVLYIIGFHPLKPLSDMLFFSRHRALVLRLLAIATQRGHPFESTLSHLSSGAPRYDGFVVTRKLKRTLRSAENGHDWRSALQHAGLLRADETQLLHAAEQAGNLPWALNALADQTLHRSLVWWQAVSQIVFPVIIFALGGFVAWIVIGLFIPLVCLIESLA